MRKLIMKKDYTMKELKAIAKELGLKGYSRLNKADLFILVSGELFSIEKELIDNTINNRENQEKGQFSTYLDGKTIHLYFGNTMTKVIEVSELEKEVTEKTEGKIMNTNTNNEQLALEFGEELLEATENAGIYTVQYHDAYGNPHRLTRFGDTPYYCVYGYAHSGINVIENLKNKKSFNQLVANAAENGIVISVHMMRLIQALNIGSSSEIEERACMYILQNMDERVTHTDAVECYEFNGFRSENPLVIAKYIEITAETRRKATK